MSVANDAIPHDQNEEILQFDLTGEGGGRWIIDGEEPFPEAQPNIARIAMRDDKDPSRFTDGRRLDSTVRLRLPSVDLDSDEIFALRLFTYISARPVVLLEVDRPITRATFLYVAQIVVEQLERADLTAEGYLNFARRLRMMGLWLLQRRTKQVERSVRDALNDEEITGPDYEALRTYPERLAKIDHLASALRRNPPVVTSGNAEQGTARSLDTYFDKYPEWVDEAAEEAREAVSRLSGLISSQQIVLTQRQGAETARFQRLVTIIGAAVLVPGLVAVIFGANVGFRGRESGEAFWAMLLLMAGSGIGSYALIRLLETQSWKALMGHRSLKWWSEIPLQRRLGAIATLALVLLAGGLALLATSQSPASTPAAKGKSALVESQIGSGPYCKQANERDPAARRGWFSWYGFPRPRRGQSRGRDGRSDLRSPPACPAAPR
jgi:CorA-like Mg2+ transporter protein